MGVFKTGALWIVVPLLMFAACSNESNGDQDGTGNGTPQRERVAVPALEDWDGRHFDIGRVSQPRRVRGGWVVQWDRFGLLTEEDPLDAEAFTDDPVEPFGHIRNLTDSPFTNVNPRLRELSITRDAWLFLKDESLLVCAEEREFSPPWREGNLEEWVKSLDIESIVLLTFDKGGRVVQIREVAGC